MASNSPSSIADARGAGAQSSSVQTMLVDTIDAITTFYAFSERLRRSRQDVDLKLRLKAKRAIAGKLMEGRRRLKGSGEVCFRC